ncbi:MAG: AMP-binding protein, partial [Lachnospiraceae bacterium]|nr:AMP-binding protein [Lachnospiraceae bacterium]
TPSRLMQYMEYAPFREALSKCCLVMVGGEGVPQTLLENLQKVLSPEAHIENAYGPTETTMACNGADMIHMDHVAAGKPLLNYKSYIVDQDGEPVPVGVVGELWIGGIGVGIGYRNLPELTAQKFITYRGKRVYRSGDYAKWDTDGNVLILGRMDNQVKLRGLRIELDEIKGLMEQQPGIKQAVVAIKKIGDEDQLCSWYTSDREIDVHGLRDALRAKLTAYMVPVAFTHVDDIPMTANGKTDLKALPEPEVLKEEIVPPQNETQKQILDIAAEIIGNTNFGVRTELYSAGLTSLNSVALSIKLSETFGVNIQIRDFKENDTVEKLERLIRGTEKEEEFEVLSEYALTKTQEGIFFESKSHPGTTIYNIPVLLELSSEIKKDRLKSAVVSAIEAHPYLKTRLLLTEKGELRQKRMDDEPFSEADIEEVICGEIAEGKDTLVKPFDLLKDRLFRIKLIRAEKEEKSYLFIDVHHIVYDGMARLILLRDISRAYAGETLTKEKYSGFEAALAEEKLRGSEHYDRAKAYYTDLFDGCEPDCLPISDVQEDTTGSGELLIPVDRVDLKAVKQFCTQKSVSENAFFTAAFGVTVAKFCGRSDAIFTTINNGRNDPRFMESVSMFVRTYPVLCKAGNRGISDYISKVGRQLVDSQSYDVYSFEEISRDLGVRSDLLFAWQGVFEPEEETFCGKPSKQIPLSLSEAKANIELQVYPYGEGIAYLCSFRKELYTESFIRRFLRVYEQVLLGFLAKERLSEISFLDAETEKQLESFNDVKADIEITDIVTLLRRQAAATPDAPAVVYLDKKYTYRQVDEISERIAAYLKGKGIGKEDVVSILIPRCEYMVLASLGVLKAGALYQPLDSTYPTERLEFMVQDAGAKLLIADRELRNLVSGYTGEILYLDEIEGLPPASSEIGSPKPEDGFIVLYTSGSTGTPKGVILEHRNLCNFVSWYRRYYDLKEDSVVAAYASYGFDADMMDLYPALTTGACVHIIAEDMRLDFPMLARYFDENSVTHSFMTTQVGRQFAEYYTGTTLKYLSVGGEKLAPMYPEGKSFTFYNLYGPTECTIVTTVYPIDR